MAALAALDVSGVTREEGAAVPVVADPSFISSVSRELEARAVARKWETPGILAVLQFAWSMSLAGLRVGGVAVTHASSHLEDDEVFMDLGKLTFSI